ncbi:MAG: hypothetical protein P4M11_13315 [Candidatus Pacebacteria bacterium]|nr:hypothetical protein [Candidatus Paceibacterota bacterium]
MTYIFFALTVITQSYLAPAMARYVRAFKMSENLAISFTCCPPSSPSYGLTNLTA